MSSDITSSPAEVAVTVNGVARALAAGSSLRDLIEALGFAGRSLDLVPIIGESSSAGG